MEVEDIFIIKERTAFINKFLKQKPFNEKNLIFLIEYFILNNTKVSPESLVQVLSNIEKYGTLEGKVENTTKVISGNVDNIIE